MYPSDLGGVSLRLGRAGGELQTRSCPITILSSSETPPRAADNQLPNRDAFKMAKHIHVKAMLPDEDEKRVEAAKTARLRAFRIAKEAADRDATNREIAAAPPRSRGRQPNHPTSRVS